MVEAVYPSISGFGISSDELTENGSITLSGMINGNEENIKTVQVSVFNPDGSKGGSIYRIENVNSKTFDLSVVSPITMDTTAGSENMKLEPGNTYKVMVYVTLENGNGFVSVPSANFDVSGDTTRDIALVWPCESAYIITCLYYYKTGEKHSTSYGYQNAIDIAGGGNVLAAGSGKVITVKDLGDTSFGKYVVIEHSDGSKTLYAHLNSYSVKEGDSVSQGQIIGVMGSSGNASGVHLHFEYSAGDPWKDFYNAEYAKNIVFEQNVRSNNDSYNGDKTVVEVIDKNYKKVGNYYYYSGLVDLAVPLIDKIKLSSSKITESSELVISTAASDDVSLKLVQLFIDGAKVKEWSVKGSYTTISHTVSGYSVGSHTVKVIAIDQSGKQNFVETEFTVEKIQGGEIYNVEMSLYNFTAGTTITFTVTTSMDTEKIRLRNGNWIFPNEITDCAIVNDRKVWVFEQYVETVGTNRVLTVETYSSGWTGNKKDVTFTVLPATNNLPSFEIISLMPGYRVDGNEDVVIQWSTPEVSPDHYVVNVSGRFTYSVEINANKISIPANVFSLGGTYIISITAQKTGYNPFSVSVTINTNCNHKGTVCKEKTYQYSPLKQGENFEDIMSSAQHNVICVQEFQCDFCGASYSEVTSYTEEHQKHLLFDDGTGYWCYCGYVQSDGNSQIAYLRDNQPQNIYSRTDDSGNVIESSKNGTVYPNTPIIVYGSIGDYYLVGYSSNSNNMVTSRSYATRSNNHQKVGLIEKIKFRIGMESKDYYAVVLSDRYVEDYDSLKSFRKNGNIIAMWDPYNNIYEEDGGTYDFHNYGKNIYLTIFKNQEKLDNSMFAQEGFTILTVGDNTGFSYTEDSSCIMIDTVDIFCDLSVIYDNGKSIKTETVIDCTLEQDIAETAMGMEAICGQGGYGISFDITDSCVWYNRQYYDYIIGFEESFWGVQISQMPESIFNKDYNEAISHMLLLSPEDAETFVKLIDVNGWKKALGAFTNYAVGLGSETELAKKLLNDWTLILAKSLDFENASVDVYELLTEILKKLLKLDKLDEYINPFNMVSNIIAFVFKMADLTLNIGSWRNYMIENIENKHGTTIVFSYARRGSIKRHVTLYSYDSPKYDGLSSWDLQDDNSIHSPWSSNERYEGYLNYDASNILGCMSDAFNATFHNIYS